jgi:flagellar biosynthesis protein FlhA
MAMFPGLPTIPFLLLGTATGYAGWNLRRNAALKEAAPAPKAHAPARENIEASLAVEPLAVELGLGLVKLVDGGANSPLMKRIAGIRKQLAADLGFVLPPVRVTDNVSLRAREYTIALKGAEIARFELPPGVELAIPPARPGTAAIEGTPTREPAFGIAALWVPHTATEAARSAGYTVVDPLSVLGTHLGESARRHAWELFSRQDAKKVLDRVAESNPKAVEDLVPKLLSLAGVQKVFQNLLRERVSIRDASTIVESLGEAAAVTRNYVLLTEYVRQSIRRLVIKPFVNSHAELPAWFLDPAIEQAVESSVEHAEAMSHLNLPPQRIREILERVQRTVGSPETPVVALTTSGARFFLRQITESAVPNLVFVAHSEIPAGVKVVSLGLIQ